MAHNTESDPKVPDEDDLIPATPEIPSAETVAQDQEQEGAPGEPTRTIDEYNAQTAEEKMEAWRAAQEIKSAGNNQFKAGCASDALELYKSALQSLELVKDWSVSEVPTVEVREMRVSLHSNSAACHLQLEQWEECLASADKVLTIQGQNLKGLYRRGVALSRLGRLSEAKADLTHVAKNDTKNKLAREELSSVKERLKQAKQADKERMKGLFNGPSMYADQIKAQQQKAAAEKKKEVERAAKEAARDELLEAEWAKEAARREEDEAKGLSLAEEWELESARQLESGELKIESDDFEAFKAKEVEAFEAFKEKRALEKAGEVEDAKKKFLKRRKTEMEDEEERVKKEAEEAEAKQREEEREARRRARIEADKNTTLELDEEDEALLAGIKKGGYCYFAEDSAKAKAGLEAVGATQGPVQIAQGQAVEVVKGGASAWNSSGTTFEERDHTSWAQDELKSLILEAKGQAVSPDFATAADAKLTKLSRSEGAATTVISSGKKKCHFEFEFKMDWEIKMETEDDNGESTTRKVTGSSTYGDATSKAVQDGTLEGKRRFSKSPADADVAVVDMALDSLEQSILAQLRIFDEHFQAR